MKAVILAAGEGQRMRPLTLKTPKQLLKISGRTILEHIINALPQEVDELVVVLGYLGDQIEKFLGQEFKGKKVRYVWQKNKLGTGYALKLCKSFLGKEKFLMLYADDLHGAEGLKRLSKHDLALATAEVEDPRRFGVATLDSKNKILEIEEKPEHPKSKTISAGAMVLDHRIFNYEAKQHKDGEYYLTTMVDKLIKEHNVFAEPVSSWIPIGYPEDIGRAEKALEKKSKMKEV